MSGWKQSGKRNAADRAAPRWTRNEFDVSVRWVPLAGVEIPVLSCESLVVFKALFNRTKDWADIEAVAEVEPQLVRDARAQLVELIGSEDEAAARLARIAGE